MYINFKNKNLLDQKLKDLQILKQKIKIDQDL